MWSDDALTDLLLAEMVESGELVKVTDADGETRYRIGPRAVPGGEAEAEEDQAQDDREAEAEEQRGEAEEGEQHEGTEKIRDAAMVTDRMAHWALAVALTRDDPAAATEYRRKACTLAAACVVLGDLVVQLEADEAAAE